MNKTILFIGIVLAMSMFIVPVMALDADDPYQIVLEWNLPTSTAFTVTICSTVNGIYFNLSTGNEVGFEPSCQNNDTGLPIFNVTNTGNVAQNFTANLTASKPAWAVLKVNNETSYTNADAFDTTAVLVQDTVAAAGDFAIYVWTDVTAATPGITTRSFQLNSARSAA